MNLFFLLLIMLASGCKLFNSEKKETEPEVEQYFHAEINGQPWSGEPRAAFTFTETDTILQVFATRFDSVKYPYNNHISFTLDYDPENTVYEVVRKYENSWIFGGAYYENDGDARIAVYEPIPTDSSYFTVKIKKIENGSELVTGAFAMTVVVDPDYDTAYNNQYRQQPDTVRITNGEFRVLLEERE